VLHRGALVARVPEPAKGFTVRSGSATLVDHGTEFGVTADGAGRTRVDVLEGLVEARHDRTGQSLRLVQGEGALLDAHGATRGAFAADPEPALHRPAAPAPAGDFVLTTATGRGRTAFVQGGPPTPERRPGPGVLLVKNCAAEAWRRKAYLAFDTAALGGRPAADATLSIALVPTGYGHAAFVPDATFTVYGVADEALDAWSVEAVDWTNAPANRPGAAAVDDARAVRVGSFVVPQGVSSGVFSVGGPALADFLRRDRNGVVTFIVVRDTVETRASGLVHGFAGNHHPAAPPPTLRVSLGAPGGARPLAPPTPSP
jgi:hypothetical protein